MRLLYFILGTIIFTGCQTYKTKIFTFSTQTFIVIDTSVLPTEFLSNSRQNSYPIYYIGFLKDTIKISNQYSRRDIGNLKYNNPVSSKTYSIKTISLFVDTAVKTNSSIQYLSADKKLTEDSAENYHAYLITLKNISDSTIYLGRTFSLYYLNLEAKDAKGNWVKINNKLCEMELCITGQPEIYLRPEEIIISKLKRYKGDFITDFRLCFGIDDNTVYSNTWRDSIYKDALYVSAKIN